MMSTNGAILPKNGNSDIKSELNDINLEEDCLIKSNLQFKTINTPANASLMIFSGQKTRHRNNSVSSMSAISTTNSCKIEVNNCLDMYSSSQSAEPSEPSESSPLSASETQAQDMFCSSTMSGDCSSNTSDIIDVKTSDNSPKRLCLVCGDTASGFHYGVASCEACKAFFKRTIQGNIEYTCPAANDCEINKRRRKACQACRFQKCLRMGMLKEGVRLDRVRGGRQKYRRSPDNPYPIQNVMPIKKANIEENKIISALISCEPEPLLATNCQNSSTSTSAQYKSICLLSDLVDRELVATIGWAKQIPGFTDLILNDQMRLLQTTWAEVLSLSLAFRSHQFYIQSLESGNSGTTASPTKLIFATDLIMDTEQAAQCRADELFNHSIQLVKRLNLIKIAKEEYLILKAILLTNADIQLEDSQTVYKLRETLMATLQECVSALQPPTTCVHHLSQLLLCMPLLRQLDGVTRRYWNTVRRESNVPMNKLFIEMLESNITMR
ncbi:steroid hormone receptor ERR1-like [Oppia nitens]|uniref:steroid hormone receptor ERR1-like n=1 Tax=Oppia nitens TaxID=1686743 RepID=UPI0023DC7405|nr:steroid hormone receptor ERR1-like [Oppia nitens]